MSLYLNRDKLVRATDIDALSCRFSANKKGYFLPPDAHISVLLESYKQNLQYCDGYTQLSAGRTLRNAFGEPKFPLINRGTYFRTQLIDLIVSQFIEEHSLQSAAPCQNGQDSENRPFSCQIVALGGGSDTRAFRMLEKYGNSEVHNVSYTEIDFPELTKIKKIAITNSATLRNVVSGIKNTETAENGDVLKALVVSDREQLASLDPDLHTQNYHLVLFDLREIAQHGVQKFAFLDKTVPTLVISECVLCYLTPEKNIEVLSFWKENFASLGVILYDPMGLNDAFGETMAMNLSKRGLDMHTFMRYPDLASRKLLFEDTLGFATYLSDLALIGGYGDPRKSWVDSADAVRVSRLEMVDEIEEIGLLLRHYCLIYAEAGMQLQFPAGLLWLL